MAEGNRLGRTPRGFIFLAVGAAFGLLAGTVLSAQHSPAAGPLPAALSAASPSTSAQASASAAPVHYQGTFHLQPERGTPGTVVRAIGSGFAPGAHLAIDWNTVDGRWVLTGSSHETFAGRAFDPVIEPLTQVTVDGSGAFAASFVAPHDFGFSHDVTVERAGAIVNKAAFWLDPTVTVTPASGPPGTPIQITMDGVGAAYLYNNWVVSYDNSFAGWISSVTTGGLARATIPATGGPGVHQITVWGGNPTFPYLNTPQSPTPDRPTFDASFTVTDGPPVLPVAAGQQSLPAVAGVQPSASGPQIWTDPQTATVGTPVVLHATGFPAGASVGLTWWTEVGSRVSGQGYDEQSKSIGTLTAAAAGTFALTLPVPNDLGGAHRIEAAVGGTTLASTSVTITPSAFPIEPAAGPPGTAITLHLKGVGWTGTANIYTVVYDNGYLGYACGFNSQGDVVIHLPAAGAPGWHFIDLYPAIYKGTDTQLVQDFLIPQLTFAADHPGERLPAFHFAFQVTGQPAG